MKRILTILISLLLVQFAFSQTVIHLNIEQPDVITANAIPDTTILYGDSITLGLTTISGGYGDYSYSWTPDLFINDDSNQNPIASPLEKTIYHVTVSDSLNCTATDSIELNLKYVITTDKSICSGDSIKIGKDYLKESGIYYDSLLSIHYQDSILVTKLRVNPLPEFFIGIDTAIITYGESILIGTSVVLQYVETPFSYNWFPNQFLNNDNLLNPLSTPENTITYYFSVIDLNNCYSTDSITISVLNNTVISERDIIEFNIYPIPSSNQISLDISNIVDALQIEILDINGNLLWIDKIPYQSRIIERTIETNLNSGIYFIRITENKGQTFFRKFIIIK